MLDGAWLVWRTGRRGHGTTWCLNGQWLTGWKEKKGTFWGPYSAGATVNLNPRPPSAIAWLLFHALSLAALSCSSIPSPFSPSHPSMKESHIPYIPALGLRPSPLYRVPTLESFPERQRWEKLRNRRRGGWRRNRKAKRDKGVLPPGLTSSPFRNRLHS